MSILQNIAQKFEALAEQVVSDVVQEAGEVGVKLVEIGKAAGGQALDAVESGFEDLVGKIGQDVTQFVTTLFADDSLSGLEKANLAATQTVQAAADKGIAIAEQDVTALVKNAYLAVKAKLASL